MSNLAIYESDFRHSLRQYRIPEHMHDGILAYIIHGIPPGDFLQALLTNDLMEAVGRADAWNSAALTMWCRWLYNEAPQTCWGSREKVAAWIEVQQKERLSGSTRTLVGPETLSGSGEAMKPICVPCQRFFRPKKNGVYFVEAMPMTVGGRPEPGTAEPERWRPYKLWSGDEWECKGCGAVIISGVGNHPVREHYMEDFGEMRDRLSADFQVNDC